MQVLLDDKMIGLAQYVILETVTWVNLDTSDAWRGGFDNLDDLEKALRRAGYRFQAIDVYQFYRLQFTWLPKVYA